VAGGANFPGGLWKDGKHNPDAKKVWWNKAYVLEEPEGKWKDAGTLPRPLGYGAAVTSEEHGVICIGGGDARKHYADVFALQWAGGKLARTDLPPLPKPCAFTSAVLLGKVVYVAGGQEAPGASAMKNFWSLDLARPAAERKWAELPPWDGPPRILAVLGVQDGAVYVISGRNVTAGGATFLNDAYRYTPGKNGTPGTWARVADLPASVCAAPSPAVTLGSAHLAVLGGDDGSLAKQAGTLADKHPGFSRDILAYHTITDTWVKTGAQPAQTQDGNAKGGHVTTTVVRWRGRVIVPSGEVSPGIRSRKVWTAAIVTPRAGFQTADYVVIAVYLAALVAMGFYFSRREKTTKDFFLGGRRVPWWAAGLSIYGTQLSAITFMAIPAKAFATNWVYYVGNLMIFAMAPVVIYLYLPFFRRLDVTTAYEYLEKRFNVATRLLGSLSFILFQLGRMGIVMYLPALALATVTGIDIYLCIAVMGLLATVYTVLGGIEAVIWTDVLQVIVLLGGALVSLCLIAGAVDGGFAGILTTARDAGKLHMIDRGGDITTTVIWVVVIGALLQNLVSYTSDQAVVQRYLTTKNEKAAARSIWTNAILCIPGSVLFFGVGTALWAFYRAQPELLNPAGRTDDIFPWFIAGQLPTGVAGLVIAGLFAAAMSSLDSSMNSMATAITTDWYRRFKRDADDARCLRLARVLTVLLGIAGTGVALFMAGLQSKSMLDNYMKVIGLFGGGLAGLFAAGIFTRRTSGPGAVVGFLASAVILFFVQRHALVHGYLYAAVGVFGCVVAGWLVSWVLPAKAKTEGLTIYTLGAKSPPVQ
jgi:SSS family transporter